MDWDDVRQSPGGRDIVVGEGLDRLSVGELEARIVALEGEIARVKAELEKKRAHESAAELLFKTGDGEAAGG